MHTKACDLLWKLLNWTVDDIPTWMLEGHNVCARFYFRVRHYSPTSMQVLQGPERRQNFDKPAGIIRICE